MAGPTRLELATSGVTGRRSNQLNYDPAGSKALHDSALRPATQGDQGFYFTENLPHRHVLCFCPTFTGTA